MSDRMIYPDTTLYSGHALEILRDLETASVHCAVTSPPYYMARLYQGDQDQVFGGERNCGHKWQEHRWGQHKARKYSHTINRADGTIIEGAGTSDEISLAYQLCAICGAFSGALGNEPDPDLYVDHLVEILNEAGRVLRRDGVLWLNLGDTYWGGSTPHDNERGGSSALQGSPAFGNTLSWKAPKHPYLKSGDKLFIPHRVAMALQRAGWWVTMDVVWHRPNGKPESVTRRPSKFHEYVFLCSRSANYWYDKLGWAEPVRAESLLRYRYKFKGSPAALSPDGTHVGTDGWGADPEGVRREPQFSNARSVWTIPTAAYTGSHFAVMPDELAERCLLLGCPPFVCAVCNKPWSRRVIRAAVYDVQDKREKTKRTLSWSGMPGALEDFEPACRCEAGVKPGIVLDMFGGTGTISVVARRHGRRSVYIDVSEEYLRQARQRIESTVRELPELRESTPIAQQGEMAL